MHAGHRTSERTWEHKIGLRHPKAADIQLTTVLIVRAVL